MSSRTLRWAGLRFDSKLEVGSGTRYGLQNSLYRCSLDRGPIPFRSTYTSSSKWAPLQNRAGASPEIHNESYLTDALCPTGQRVLMDGIKAILKDEAAGIESIHYRSHHRSTPIYLARPLSNIRTMTTALTAIGANDLITDKISGAIHAWVDMARCASVVERPCRHLRSPHASGYRTNYFPKLSVSKMPQIGVSAQ
jgi:hypothetical protein